MPEANFSFKLFLKLPTEIVSRNSTFKIDINSSFEVINSKRNKAKNEQNF